MPRHTADFGVDAAYGNGYFRVEVIGQLGPTCWQKFQFGK